MAPGPGGSLFVSIPTPDGSVVGLLDASGRPSPGWPIALTGVTECGQPLPGEDGSVRLVCTLVDPEGGASNAVAFAFGANGGELAGWPVVLDGSVSSARMVGDDLTLFASWPLVDVVDDKPDTAFGIVSIAADGSLHGGAQVPMFCCEGKMAIGPDDVVPVLTNVAGDGSTFKSDVAVVDRAGLRTGWPRTLDGIASAPASAADGRIVLTVGSPARRTSKILAFDRDGTAIGGAAAAIPIVTVDDTWGDTGGCSANPMQPLVAADGTTFIFSDADPAIVALDGSLKLMRGWPYRPPTPLVRRDERYVKEDAYCPATAVPAVGPDHTLYLPLQARNSKIGGSLLAVGPNGRARSGWPVELKRSGSEFWSVVVGLDGTAYGLAIEPESSRTSSASIVAIAPDSTVRYSTTIVNP